ncbi:hypothetical protein JOB18_014668 [Solea senegalensis]|uniref:Uncharacterized protein n=1 Tax=Solea senegalensis TaxID=28829 RepID=A0AAV6PFQ0_SOLSE|nr:hypothetical protein JOB18_014668 [Solea senegalensis]
MMEDLMTFKNHVSFIVSHLAKTVMTEIFTAAGKQSPRTDDRLTALVDRLCVEAVEKILQLVEVSRRQCDVTELSNGAVTTTQEREGEDGVGDHTPSGHTHILVYGNDDAVDSRCLQVSLQSHTHAGGETKTRLSEETAEVKSLLSSAPHANIPDHEYAQISSGPPGRASPEEGATSTAGKRKRGQGRRKNMTDQTTASVEKCSQCEMLFPNAERLDDHRHYRMLICVNTVLRFNPGNSSCDDGHVAVSTLAQRFTAGDRSEITSVQHRQRSKVIKSM